MILYAAGIFDVIESFGLSGHSYADDTQLYVSVPASESQAAAAKLAACVKALDEWMGSNRLKTECRQDPANMDRHSAAAGQTDRH